MTERLADTRRRIESLQQVKTVVTAMRGIAASRAQHARGLLPGVRTYASVIAKAIGQAIALVPDRHDRPHARTTRVALILFCAEQGFVGAFNDRMLKWVAAEPQASNVFLIGSRGAMLARERSVPLEWQSAMVSSASLVPVLAGRIADALYRWLPNHAAHGVDVIVPTWSTTAGLVVQRRSLIPFDFARFPEPAVGPPPLLTLPPALLLTRLAEEYVFAELCEAALTAFAAENEARVATMLSAKNNLERMGSDLQGLERQIRQEEVTAEVVELASGAQARIGQELIWIRGHGDEPR